MKILKVLEVICEVIIVAGSISVIGLFGSIENDCMTFMQIIPYFITGIIVIGLACLGLRYIEAYMQTQKAKRKGTRY